MTAKDRYSMWASSILDQEKREARLKRARIMEIVCCACASLLACLAVWGYTVDTPVMDTFSSGTVGGISTLCFAALMFLAAGAGIEQRFIAMITTLEEQSIK